MYKKTVLNNGVRVITESLPHVYSVSLGIWVESGSREENSSNNGISHFIEHMLFKGTENRSAFEIAREVESVGGTINAFTSREYTFFYAKVLKEHLRLASEILCDIFLNSLFDEGEVEKEKDVVCQEILMIEDNPEDHIHDFLYTTIWPNNSLGMPVQGRQETVRSFTRDSVCDYFTSPFNKAGIIIIAVGNVDHDEILSIFSDPFDSSKFTKEGVRKKKPEQSRGIFVQKRDIEQVHLCIGMPGPGKRDSHRYPAFVLNAILGSGMSSRLFQEAREKRGLVYSIYSSVSTFGDSGMFKIYAGTTPNKVADLMSVIADVLADIRKSDLTDGELGRAKEQIKGNLLINFESTDFRLTRLASNEMYFGRHIPPDEVSRQIDEVTKGDVLDFGHNVLREDRTVVAAIGNISSDDIGAKGFG